MDRDNPSAPWKSFTDMTSAESDFRLLLSALKYVGYSPLGTYLPVRGCVNYLGIFGSSSSEFGPNVMKGGDN